MENIEQLSTFYKHRGFTGRLSEGYMFLEKNFRNILRVGSLVLIPYAIVQALSLTWLLAGVQNLIARMNVASAVTAGGLLGEELLPIVGSMLVALLVFLVGISSWKAFMFGMFRKYIELGYVPTMRLGAWCSWVQRDVWRYFLYMLFVLFFWAIVAALSYMLLSLTAWLMLLVLPVALYCIVVLALFPYFYMIEREPLWNAFLHAFRKGTPAWGATFAIVVLTGIIACAFSTICSIPMSVTVMVDNLVTRGTLDGAQADLPVYYTGLKVLFGALSIYVNMFMAILIGAPLLFHYASLASQDKAAKLAEARAEQERLKAEQARRLAEKEKEAARRDGSAYLLGKS